MIKKSSFIEDMEDRRSICYLDPVKKPKRDCEKKSVK